MNNNNKKTFVKMREEYKTILQRQKDYFFSGSTKNIKFRISMLKKLYNTIKEFEGQIIEALYKDLHKSEFESYSNEIGIIYGEIRHLIKHIKKWSKKKKLKKEIYLQPSKAFIKPEPYGVTLIIAPWNYPFQLLFAPLIGAIAAGNTAIIKPSELSKHTAKVITNMVEQNFSPEFIKVINGGVEETATLLDLPVDYIFFTGSVPVGKIVMRAASKRLIPLTLELGGKSPVFVDESSHLPMAAKRITWGKFNNAGQTCVAPDYILVDENVKDKLIDELKKSISVFYSENIKDNPNFGRIISDKHFDRLKDLLDGVNIVFGGEYDKHSRYIAPTIIDNVKWEDKIMDDEIFGPLLPIISYTNLDDAIAMVNSRPKPLSLYIFSKNKKNIQKISSSISYGGGGVNNTLLHVASSTIPFGGVGESGMGNYHGVMSFKTFSHYKSILCMPAKFDLGLNYPNKHISMKMLRKIMK